MGYMLARLQVRYGKVTQLCEVMPDIVRVMESQGWKLLGAYQTQIGRFHEVWDVWDVGGDAGSIAKALEGARKDPDFMRAAARLPEIIEEEEIRYMEKVPFSP